MTDTLTLTGLVGTTPRHVSTSEGFSITSFRLGSTQRRYDKATKAWVDGDTNWYTISCFRRLAPTVLESIKKGDRVVVTGRLRIRDWESGEKKGTNIEVYADAIGHDLAWGTSVFTRTARSAELGGGDAGAGSSGSDADEYPAAEAAGEGDDDESFGAGASASEARASDGLLPDDVPVPF